MNHFYQNIEGWSTLEDQGELIKSLLTNYDRQNKIKICEIGVYMGRGTAIWNVELINAGVDYEYYAVDHFEGSIEHRITNMGPIPKIENVVKNLESILHKINIVPKDSVTASKLFEDQYFDIIYIDASHEYLPVREDIISWWPKLKNGGFMCGDDYVNGWPGVIQAVNELFQDRVGKIGNQQWWTRK